MFLLNINLKLDFWNEKKRLLDGKLFLVGLTPVKILFFMKNFQFSSLGKKFSLSKYFKAHPR